MQPRQSASDQPLACLPQCNDQKPPSQYNQPCATSVMSQLPSAISAQRRVGSKIVAQPQCRGSVRTALSAVVRRVGRDKSRQRDYSATLDHNGHSSQFNQPSGLWCGESAGTKVGSALDSSLPVQAALIATSVQQLPVQSARSAVVRRVGRDERGQRDCRTTIWCAAPSCPCRTASKEH
jgi:hypothetical protein